LSKAVEEVLTASKRWTADAGKIRTAPIFESPQMLGLLSTAVSAGVMHR
jgi:hypothetical protein